MKNYYKALIIFVFAIAIVSCGKKTRKAEMRKHRMEMRMEMKKDTVLTDSIRKVKRIKRHKKRK